MYPPKYKKILAMNSNILILILLLHYSYSTLINGDQFTGGNLTSEDGDTISGIFSNVDTFTLSEANTIFIHQDEVVEIHCKNALINGRIDGIGRGQIGAPSNPLFGQDGLDGEGPGSGKGGFYFATDPSGLPATGGGGAGYTSNGGDSSSGLVSFMPVGDGGSTYGNINDDSVLKGSGGGSAGNPRADWLSFGGAGGSGGGAILIHATNYIHMTDAEIDVRGQDGIQGTVNIINTYGVSGGG